jgi:hypothetical protein
MALIVGRDAIEVRGETVPGSVMCEPWFNFLSSLMLRTSQVVLC